MKPTTPYHLFTLLIAFAAAAGACGRPLNPNACVNQPDPNKFCGDGKFCWSDGVQAMCRELPDGSPDVGPDMNRLDSPPSADVVSADAGQDLPPDLTSGAEELPPADAGCMSVCAVGARRCGTNGGVQECAAAAGSACSSWATEVPCAGAKTCNSGTAMCTCPATCAAGTQRCGLGGGVQSCVAQADGCPAWSAEVACASPKTCQAQAGCVCAPGGCSLGAKRCGPTGGTQTCEMNGACTTWGTETDCTAPKDGSPICSSGTCGFTCNSGTRKCDGACFECCDAEASACNVASPRSGSCSNHKCVFSCVPGTITCDNYQHCLPTGICVMAISQSSLDTIPETDFCPLVRGGGDGTSTAWLVDDDSPFCDTFRAAAEPKLCAGRPSGTSYLLRKWIYDGQGKFRFSTDNGPTACP